MVRLRLESWFLFAYCHLRITNVMRQTSELLGNWNLNPSLWQIYRYRTQHQIISVIVEDIEIHLAESLSAHLAMIPSEASWEQNRLSSHLRRPGRKGDQWDLATTALICPTLSLHRFVHVVTVTSIGIHSLDAKTRCCSAHLIFRP